MDYGDRWEGGLLQRLPGHFLHGRQDAKRLQGSRIFINSHMVDFLLAFVSVNRKANWLLEATGYSW